MTITNDINIISNKISNLNITNEDCSQCRLCIKLREKLNKNKKYKNVFGKILKCIK